MEPSEVLYRLDSDFCILVMESGASITIADALDYLAMDIKIAPEPVVPDMKEEGDDEDDGEAKPENLEVKLESGDDPLKVDDDPTLPKVRLVNFSHCFAYRKIPLYFSQCARNVWRSCRRLTSSSFVATRIAPS